MNESYIDLPNSAGTIGFNRVQGSSILYGFPFQVQGYIRLTISTAKEKRCLSNTGRFSGKEVISVDLSYSQFAEAITTMNGCGNTPCTIRYIQGKRMEDIELINERQEFDEEVKEAIDTAIEALNEALDEVESCNISKKAKAAIKAKIFKSYRSLTDSAPFVVKQYAERMEDITTQAKIEFSAYCDQTVRSYGLDSIQSNNLLKES